MTSKCNLKRPFLSSNVNQVKLLILFFSIATATPKRCTDNLSKTNINNDLEETLLRCKEFERLLQKEKMALAERRQLWVAFGKRIIVERKCHQLQRNLFRKSYWMRYYCLSEFCTSFSSQNQIQCFRYIICLPSHRSILVCFHFLIFATNSICIF